MSCRLSVRRLRVGGALLEGRVRLESGEPVADAQVRLDLLRQGEWLAPRRMARDISRCR